ncbi:hypothetical protein QGX11_gp120 [Pseudomonas phage PPSC2]|uniref:Uncharacterized protein n=1 Tax=Pseudomonas phage PPSC2 TaxID=2041350 RepID=A0A2R2YB10_9CAUD|nr:hypothetical protein QGX11_gp120 [Pseudomonas phage PPSC2]ATN92883.1 hypothetical protein PPSC2_120 [Pseudomonas phage PPSC2]
MKGESTTGWTAYVRTYKAKYPDQEVDYKALMQKYIKGEPV